MNDFNILVTIIGIFLLLFALVEAKLSHHHTWKETGKATEQMERIDLECTQCGDRDVHYPSA